jgi:cell wall-associated NlpC family hydrolase
LKLDLDNPDVYDVLRAWGVPYSYGGGTPADGERNWPDGAKGLKGGVGWDCSGFAQAALVRMELLSPLSKDRTAQSLYDLTVPVTDTPRVGDLSFYGRNSKNVSHVMVICGDGCCIGASGGTSFTNGNDPTAFVQIHRVDYRRDFLGIRRVLRTPLKIGE